MNRIIGCSGASRSRLDAPASGHLGPSLNERCSRRRRRTFRMDPTTKCPVPVSNLQSLLLVSDALPNEVTGASNYFDPFIPLPRPCPSRSQSILPKKRSKSRTRFTGETGPTECVTDWFKSLDRQFYSHRMHCLIMRWKNGGKLMETEHFMKNTNSVCFTGLLIHLMKWLLKFDRNVTKNYTSYLK